MAIDIFSGKKSGRHARKVQRAEQAKRDSERTPSWRVEPEHLGSKTFLSGLFVTAAFLGLFHFGMLVYSRAMENSLDYIQKKIPIGEVLLCRPLTSEDKKAYIQGEFENLSLDQMIDDGLFLDNNFMKHALEEEFYNLNNEKIKDKNKCHNYLLRDFSKNNKITLSDGVYPIDFAE